MKKDGYFESKRLKLPRTSTTAELHRPLTLSLSLSERISNIQYLGALQTRTQIKRRQMYIQTSRKRKEKRKRKRKKQKKCMLSLFLSRGMMSLHLISLPLFPRMGKSRYTQTQIPSTCSPVVLYVGIPNLRHMKRSNLPFDLFLKNKSELFFPSSLPFHCLSIAFFWPI